MSKKEIGKIENLVFSYDGTKNVLNDISFSIYEGETLSIIGSNGSGKSTLAKILVGLLDKFNGNITLFDKQLEPRNIRFIRKNAAIVFQNPDNQFVGSTVEDDIAFGLENISVLHEEMQERVDKFADLVGMKDYLTFEPSNLSGGQKQRVAIAGVLAMKPKMIIFDESTSMLDPKARADLSKLILYIKKNKAPELTILTITHDIDETLNSDRVIVLEKGKIAFDDKPLNLYKNPKYVEKYPQNLPFVFSIKEKLKQKGIVFDDDIDSLDKLKEALCK